MLFVPLAMLLSWYPALLALAGVEASGINPLGPLAAALIVLGITVGRDGVKDLLRRMITFKAAPRWYAFAVLLPALMVGTAAAIAVALGAQMDVQVNAEELALRVAFFMFFVSLGEEPGWRGYLLPMLRKRHGLLAASLLLGVVWSIWHIPVMFEEFPPSILPAFVINVLAASVVLAWLYEHSGGNIVVCMVLHTAVNAIGAGAVFQWFAGDSLVMLWWVYTALWTSLAVAIGWHMRTAGASDVGTLALQVDRSADAVRVAQPVRLG
ncbi:MAG TPA: CPBP family intramembrane metalloprotease [Xanthomonadaceae bacterium]|nr:CPBP family intramembrane metalloprotease [Xanthomonadaceae bacterium]